MNQQFGNFSTMRLVRWRSKVKLNGSYSAIVLECSQQNNLAVCYFWQQRRPVGKGILDGKRKYEADGREQPNDSGERVRRGGDHVFDSAPDELTAYYRTGFSREPDRGHRPIGCRCAQSPF